MNREFLMLAHNIRPSDKIAGWFASEKLDGIRAFWDGGYTRGMPTTDVPWANLDKTVRPYSTGLWSRYGNVISAPGWFLDKLPAILLDGELYIGPGMFQTVSSVVRRHEPDDRWKQIRYAVFEAPGFYSVFKDGQIKNTNFKKIIDSAACAKIYAQLPRSVGVATDVFNYLQDQWDDCVPQHKLPNTEDAARERVDELMAEIHLKKGEGLILRNPRSYYDPVRTRHLLKVKPKLDAEGTVVGYISGKGKLLGMLGALIVKYRDKTFELSGFTDAERSLTIEDSGWAAKHPGTMIPVRALGLYPSQHFPIGSQVTFLYRELSDDGIPKEARYLRKPI